jgi:hypothetical protein
MNINKIRKWTMTQTCTGWSDQSWDKLHFLMYRPSCLIEAYTVPEKYWLVSIELLAVYLFNEGIIFCHRGEDRLAQESPRLLPEKRFR